MNHYQILLVVLCIIAVVFVNVIIWFFSELSEHEVIWRVGSFVVSVISIVGLVTLMTVPNSKSQTVVYILNADGDIVETYEGVSGVVSNYTSISFDWDGKNYYFKNVPVKVIE